MTYDSNISTDVSLSKVLDQMICDGTSHEIIVQFLKSHENCIKDIFANSSFVYDLYDITSLGYFPKKDIEEYICYLPTIPKFFVLTSYIDFALATDLYDQKKKYAHMLSSDGEAKKYLSPYCGLDSDRQFIGPDFNLIEYLDRIATSDRYELDNFLEESHLVASAFSLKVFSNLSPVTQYLLIKKVAELLDESKDVFISNKTLQKQDVLAYCIVSLIKQSLFYGDIELFRHIRDIVFSISQKIMIMSDFICSRIPEQLIREIRSGRKGFVESVFDMNMIDTQFDTLDLFLYICFCNRDMWNSMLDNMDLLEFFNLPFDYNEFFIKNERK